MIFFTPNVKIFHFRVLFVEKVNKMYIIYVYMFIVDEQWRVKSMKRLVSIACSALMTLSVVGTPTFAKDESVVTIAKENDVISMDSTYATDGMSFEMIQAVIDGLETVDKDGNVIPALAESYETSEDGLTWTFKIRDAKWSNGTKITANDFEFAWKTTVSNPAAEYSYLFTEDGACIKGASEAIESQDGSKLAVTAVDDNTLQVELSRKCPYFLSLMAFPVFYPVNQKFYEKKGDKYAVKPSNLLSCGAYEMKTWEKGTKIVLVKNKKYWDAKNVKTDKLVVNIVPEVSTSALDFESGNCDFTKLNSTLVDKYKDNEAYTSVLDGYLWYLQYNYDNEALQNKNVRLALSTIIDRKDLVDNVLKDGSVAIGGFVPNELANGPDGKDFRETAKSYYTASGSKAVKQAQKYWKEAKKELGKKKIKLRFLYETSDPAKPTAEYLQSAFSQLDGLEIEMVAQEKENRIEMQKKGDFDISLTRWGPDYADPTTYLNLMLDGNAYNYGKYSNPEFDAKMNEAATTDDESARWQALQDAEAIIMDDVPVVGLFQVGGACLINKNVTGIENHTVGVPYIYKNVKKS